METSTDQPYPSLTLTEGRVLMLLTTSLSLSDIAWILDISRDEVEDAAVGLYRKFDL